MKNLFLNTVLILSLILISCEKEKDNINNDFENFNSLYENLIFKNNLDDNLNYNLDDLEVEVINDNEFVYTLPVNLKNLKSNEEEKTRLTIHTDNTNSRALTFLITEKDFLTENRKEISYRYFENFDRIADFSFYNGDLIDFIPNCDPNSSDCFACAIGEITGDFIGFVACAVHPFSCGLAAWIYCNFEFENQNGVYHF